MPLASFWFSDLASFVEVDVSPIEHTHQILVYLPFEEADVIADFLSLTDYRFCVSRQAAYQTHCRSY